MVKTSEFDFECTPPPPEAKSKDPFDLSISSTVDFTQALHSLREKQEANKRDKPMNAERKAKGRKTRTVGNRTESSSAAEFSEDEVKDAPTTKRGRKTITITQHEETQPTENRTGAETKPHKSKKGRKDQVPKKEMVSNDAVVSSSHELTDNEETNVETKPHKSKKGRKDQVSKKEIVSYDAFVSSSHELTDNEETAHSEPMDKISLSETDSIVSQDGKSKKRKIKLTAKSIRNRNPVVDHTTETESDRESVASETSEPGNKKLKQSKPKRTQKKKGGKKPRAQSEQLDNGAENTPTTMSPRLQQVTVTKSKSTTSHKYSLQLEEATPIQINKRRGRTNLGVSPAASATANLSLTDVDLNAVSDDDTLTKDISAISQQCEGKVVDSIRIIFLYYYYYIVYIYVNGSSF